MKISEGGREGGRGGGSVIKLRWQMPVLLFWLLS